MEYKSAIKFCSKTLTAKERIKIKDTSNACKLDEATQDSSLVIKPDYYAILSIHNEKAEQSDYDVYVVVDKNGTKFVTGSESFYKAFSDIMEEMADAETDEEFDIEIYRLESKNYKGKSFITCSII